MSKMMKAFRNKEDPATAPLLAAKPSSKAITASSSSAATGKPHNVKLLLPTVMTNSRTASTCSNTAPCPCTPEQNQRQKEGLSHRSSPQYRSLNIVSPTAITLKRRSPTFPVASTVSSPSIRLDDAAMKKIRSEDISRSSSLVTQYKPALDKVYENFGVEQRNPQLKHFKGNHRKGSRGRASTCPTDNWMTFLPIQETKKKESGPVDIYEVSRDFTYTTIGSNDKSCYHHQRPSSSLNALGQLDTERLLNQMGMDVVTTEDVEGEYTMANNPRQKNHTQRKNRAHSYSHPLEYSYKECGQRKLVELEQEQDRGEARGKNMMAKVESMKRMARKGIRTIRNHNHQSEGRVDSNHDKPSTNKVLKSKVLSILVRIGSVNQHTNTKDRVPEQIVAVAPTTSKDNTDATTYPMQPEDMEMLYKWQVARMRSANYQQGLGSSPWKNVNNHEDVLSIGDETEVVDNRRRYGSVVSC